MRGTLEQAIDYCRKDESRDDAAGFGFTELGEKPAGQGKRTDLDAVAAMVREGRKRRDIAAEHGTEFIKFHKGIAALDSALNDTPREAPPQVFWFWGPTGTGKTRAAYAACEADGGAYFKMSTNKWWDGYERHENVIIDDFRRDFSTFAELLRLLDRYPMTVEVKGGSVQFVAKRIYITTPKCIVDTWEGRTEEDIQQLRRRVTEERHFPGVPVVPAMFAAGFVPPHF